MNTEGSALTTQDPEQRVAPARRGLRLPALGTFLPILALVGALLAARPLAQTVSLVPPLAGARQVAPDALEPSVDRVFSKFNTATPGCAVGVSVGGRAVLQKAYGMADLEHDVPNQATTVFEAGSVSKQFTAAAVLLLAHEGKLSLDDPVRKYIPELPDYGTPLLIRHMLTHTSGLRDWGEVESIAGWPRTTRVYTHAHVLDIVSRQHALNFEPGTNWSYSNTGYNLAAIIVARVSGTPFAQFCRTRLFEPLGMTATSWRDEYRRIVKGRAIGYELRDGNYMLDMPFENVHGNGGLLTTVGDLLRWNENFVDPKVGGEQFVQEEQQPGRFKDGRAHDYALGLYVRHYKGVSEVAHSGSTAGYRAYLTRYPEQHVSVAVLCNAGGASAAERYAHEVADLYLGDAVKPNPAPGANPSANDDRPITDAMKARAGLYRSTTTGGVLSIEMSGARFLLSAGGAPIEIFWNSETALATLNGDRRFEFDAKGVLTAIAPNGTKQTYERVEPVRPTPTQLHAYEGTYWSEDAETLLVVALNGDELRVTRRPDTRISLRPLYKDAFAAPGLGLIRFRRNAQNRVHGLSVVLDRVWDMRFERRATPGT